jgi:hypothetical protein
MSQDATAAADGSFAGATPKDAFFFATILTNMKNKPDVSDYFPVTFLYQCTSSVSLTQLQHSQFVQSLLHAIFQDAFKRQRVLQCLLPR